MDSGAGFQLGSERFGALTIPAMVERGYDKYFSAALVAAAGCVAS